MTYSLVSHDSRSAADILRWSKTAVNPALRTAVGRLPEPLRIGAGYHFGWCDLSGLPVAEDAGHAGKAIRPALALLAARAVGGSSAEAVPAAVAVELVHNFSLIHDDVMDGDETRRQRPAVWTVMGVAEAILVGDALLALALQEVAHSPRATDCLAGCVAELCRGQMADVGFERQADVTMDECLRMVAGKTGSLLSAACVLGALAGGADDHQIEHMRRYGGHLGLAFQLVDDLMGIWGDPAVTGKPAGSDLARRKKSAPVVAALNSGTAAGAELAAMYSRTEPMDALDVRCAADLIQQAGGRDWVEERAAAELAAAAERLEVMGGAPAVVAELSTLAHLITRRNR